VAIFLPQYQFAHRQPDDLENFTNRCPYPMLDPVREASVQRAIAAHGFSPQATAHIGSCSDNHFLAATAAEPLPAASTYYSAIALTYRDK
jgi:hypothetical protein